MDSHLLAAMQQRVKDVSAKILAVKNEGPGIGIDFGTGECCVAVFSATQTAPEIVPAEFGGSSTPAWITCRENSTLYGEAARKLALMDPKKALYKIKRLLGTKLMDDDVLRLRNEVAFDMNPSPNLDGSVILSVAHENESQPAQSFKVSSYSPAEVVSMLIRNLKELATNHMGEAPKIAVVGVPHHFTEKQTEAFQSAVALSGIKVGELISEPISIALAHGLNRFKGDKTALICDFGQHAFRASLVDISGPTLTVAEHHCEDACGCEKIEEFLFSYCLAEFKRQHPVIKIDIATDVHQITVELKDFVEGCELRIHLTRTLLQDLAADIFSKIHSIVTGLLKRRKMEPFELYKVVLAGGGAHIPKMREVVANAMEGKEISWDDVGRPEESVARGAALRVATILGIMAEVGREYEIADRAPLSLGIEVEGGVMKIVIQKDTPTPCHRSITFSIATQSQSGAMIQVFEGERYLTRENQLLGRFLLDGIGPSMPGDNNIRVSFTIDLHNDLNVTATDLFSGVSKGIKITAAERRLGVETTSLVYKEAVEYAEHDERERLKVIARNNLESDCLYFGRILREETEAGRVGDVEGKSQLENVILDTLDWLRYNRDEDEATYIKLLEELKDVAAPVMQHMSKALAQRAAGGPPPIILD